MSAVAGVLLPALTALVLAAAAVAYVVAAVGAARTPRGWPATRTASWLAGIGLLAAAGSLDDGDPRVHVVSHLLAGMVAPVALVLAAPVTLLLRTGSPALRRRVAPVLRSRALRVLTHPVVVLLLGPGGAVALYLTPLYAAAARDPLLHELVHVHVIVSGCLLAWVVAGPDPAPHRPGTGVRVAVLGLAAATHAVLAKVMYAGGHPRGAGHGEEELRAAAELMYYGGDVAEVLLASALFAGWLRAQGHRRRRAAARMIRASGT